MHLDDDDPDLASGLYAIQKSNERQHRVDLLFFWAGAVVGLVKVLNTPDFNVPMLIIVPIISGGLALLPVCALRKVIQYLKTRNATPKL
jgi:hypothetical protein